MFKKFTSIALFYALSLLLGTVGCSKQNLNSSVPGLQSTEEIFSDRSVGMTTEILMIQLFEPALLETNMSEEDLRAIQLEQSEFEYQLSRISGEIKILYRYRYTLNGFAVVTPNHLVPKIKELLNVKSIETASPFAKPQVDFKLIQSGPIKDAVTSVSFMGARALHEQGIKGQGVSVGIIDTGIDYTHSMLGGSGNPEDYKSIDPNRATPFFPNEKVVGGIDLVGTRFTGRADVYDEIVPQPDLNPIDEAGHGTHVAGTVAGRGDGENTYHGVAPEAKLHAIKVFGKDGATFDAIVIAGFEYAMDPNRDMKIDDRLDVVNLSLGGGYGSKKILYSKAIGNLVKSGMVVVAAAGNDGEITSVVGAPATAEEAISVAASIDGREVNWKFATVQFDLPSGEEVVAEFLEGPITKPLSEVQELKGKLVDIGLADKDLTEEQKSALAGNVALIQRGVVTFVDKLKRAADAGAIGAIVYNNADGPPIVMGSEDESIKINMPAVMVAKDIGERVAQAVKLGSVTVDFKNDDIIEKPELIDSITDFSSRGPRTGDYGFKPELSAPGQQILSAAMATGNEGALSNGTSMAAPHVAGAVALLREMHPRLNSNELKSLLMTTAKKLTAPKTDQVYPYSSQGAGRVQLKEAAQADFFATGAVSLGFVEVPQTKSLSQSIVVQNLSSRIQQVQLSFSGNDLALDLPPSITLHPGERQEVQFEVRIQTGEFSEERRTQELNGTIFLNGKTTQIHIPVMAYRSYRSQITMSDFDVSNETVGKSQDKRTSLTIENKNPIPGTALLFNLIDKDDRKVVEPGQEWRSDACDLQSVGYRWLSKPTASGQKPHLQFAFQLYERRNHLKHCDFSVLVDSDKDGSPDQEIVGISDQSVHGFQGQEFFAAVLDYKKAQEIRTQYEMSAKMGKAIPLDYRPAILAMGELHFASDSGLTVFEVPTEAIKANENSNFLAKLVAINNLGDAIEVDDYLAEDSTSWRELTTNRFQMGFWGMEDLELAGSSERTISFMKSQGLHKLVLYSPTNKKTSEMEVLP